MLNKTFLPAALAVSLAAGLSPAYASMTLPHQSPPAAPATVQPLDDAALAQLAMEAGITVDQARHLTISQLAALKEAHDS